MPKGHPALSEIQKKKSLLAFQKMVNEFLS